MGAPQGGHQPMGGSPFGPPECAVHAVKHGMNATIRSPWEARPGRGPKSAARAPPGPGATVPLDFEVPEHLSRPGRAEPLRGPGCADVPTFFITEPLDAAFKRVILQRGAL